VHEDILKSIKKTHINLYKSTTSDMGEGGQSVGPPLVV